jgi:hypothetical protein
VFGGDGGGVKQRLTICIKQRGWLASLLFGDAP